MFSTSGFTPLYNSIPWPVDSCPMPVTPRGQPVRDPVSLNWGQASHEPCLHVQVDSGKGGLLWAWDDNLPFSPHMELMFYAHGPYLFSKKKIWVSTQLPVPRRWDESVMPLLTASEASLRTEFPIPGVTASPPPPLPSSVFPFWTVTGLASLPANSRQVGLLSEDTCPC